MSKCLFSMAVALSFAITPSFAQLFTLETDTVCPRQPVNIISHAPAGAASYYWGFCSGYLENPPAGTNLGATFGFTLPADIEVKRQNKNYIGFVVDNSSDSLYRLEFGAKLFGPPISTNLGNLTNTFPSEAQGMHLVYDSSSSKNFMFVVGGNTTATSTLTRIDFGNDLMNTPNVVNFGNLFNELFIPSAIQVLNDGNVWYGFIANTATNEILRLDFGTNISNTPAITNLGNSGTLSGVGDMTAVKDENGDWYLALVNTTSSTMSILSFGNSLSNIPVGSNLGNPDNKFFNPSGINYIKECGGAYFFVTNALSNEIVRLEINDLQTGALTATSYINPAGLNLPAGISNMIRDQDSLFAYAVNLGDGSLSEIKFEQCQNSTLVSSDQRQPPSFSYNIPGLYNIYLHINEGMPDNQVYCQQIRVIPFPGITLSNDTILCQHDTVTLYVQSATAYEFKWYPDYNTDTLTGNELRVNPDYSTAYHVVMAFPNGCVVDTPINVEVIKNHADAGEDRTLSDGSYTMLGGPTTSIGSAYNYNWFPDDYLDKWDKPVVKSNPLNDITYYFEVSTTQKGFTCVNVDTVIVNTICDNLHLPNAFAPSSPDAGEAKFGLLNKNILKLNFFRIYDRWGQLVFETTNPTEKWDGTVGGTPAPLGVYMWTVDAFCIAGERYEKAGNVTLLR